MATKAVLVNGEEQPKKRLAAKTEPSAMNRALSSWQDFTHFLTDVRSEMRKVVAPSRKEVEATTTVVLIAVFLFGLYFFLVDSIFSYGLDRLLKQLSGLRQ